MQNKFSQLCTVLIQQLINLIKLIKFKCDYIGIDYSLLFKFLSVLKLLLLPLYYFGLGTAEKITCKSYFIKYGLHLLFRPLDNKVQCGPDLPMR